VNEIMFTCADCPGYNGWVSSAEMPVADAACTRCLEIARAELGL